VEREFAHKGKSKIKNQKLKLWKPGWSAWIPYPSTLLRTSFCILIPSGPDLDGFAF
jgi:hypothetical protein